MRYYYDKYHNQYKTPIKGLDKEAEEPKPAVFFRRPSNKRHQELCPRCRMYYMSLDGHCERCDGVRI